MRGSVTRSTLSALSLACATSQQHKHRRKQQEHCAKWRKGAYKAFGESLKSVFLCRYPSYNITTFYPLWLFTDQYMLVLPNTMQNIFIAIGSMIVIALLLIPQPVCAIWVALCIVSIDVGVIGCARLLIDFFSLTMLHCSFMTLWGVNLDAISMITLIMSIGFSVDFSAHVTYGYVVAEEKQPSQRVRCALATLGWPIFQVCTVSFVRSFENAFRFVQGAMSTIIGVVVLSDVNAYMIVTFFKTVFLVIIIGLMHGLIFLPVLLSLFVRGPCVNMCQVEE